MFMAIKEDVELFCNLIGPHCTVRLHNSNAWNSPDAIPGHKSLGIEAWRRPRPNITSLFPLAASSKGPATGCRFDRVPPGRILLQAYGFPSNRRRPSLGLVPFVYNAIRLRITNPNPNP